MRNKQSVPTQKSATPPKAQSYLESSVLFDCIGEGAIITDERGYIARINQSALQILGYKEEELTGKWYTDAILAENVDGSEIPNIDRPITEAFLRGESVFRRICYRKKDGTLVPVALTVSPLVFNNQPIGAIQVFRDISEEVELEKAKDEFISIASHQLRTPATVVKQYTGMLLEGYAGELSDTQKQMLQKAYQYNNTQLHIINDLLKVAQADANRVVTIRKPTDMVHLLKEVIASSKLDYDSHHVQLIFKTLVKSVMCNVDPLHMRMIFENLLSNANKYSPEERKVVVELKDDLDNVIISVKDEGVGIALKDLPKLFTKFSRIDNPLSHAGGTGLGLYWAKKLVDLHGGQVIVTSKLNKGTTFTVEIPKDVKV